MSLIGLEEREKYEEKITSKYAKQVAKEIKHMQENNVIHRYQTRKYTPLDKMEAVL